MYDQPAYKLKNPITRLIIAVKIKFSNLKPSGGVLDRYPAKHVAKAVIIDR